MISLDDFASLTDVQWRSRHEVEHGVYIAEGTKTIQRALLAGHALRSVITEQRWVPGLLQIGVDPSLISVHTEAEMQSITGYHVHRGALAAFNRPIVNSLLSTLQTSRRVVVVEDVVDHANIGAIFRSAAAFEIDALVLTTACADPFYRRSIKVSMGAVFAVPWARADWPSIVTALSAHSFLSLALTPANDAQDIRSLEPTVRSERLALVLGTEGDGLTERALTDCTMRVQIPMSHGVDSLNVAAAAAVACYELTR